MPIKVYIIIVHKDSYIFRIVNAIFYSTYNCISYTIEHLVISVMVMPL